LTNLRTSGATPLLLNVSCWLAQGQLYCHLLQNIWLWLTISVLIPAVIKIQAHHIRCRPVRTSETLASDCGVPGSVLSDFLWAPYWVVWHGLGGSSSFFGFLRLFNLASLINTHFEACSISDIIMHYNILSLYGTSFIKKNPAFNWLQIKKFL
jgi:hypothetical protein